MAAAKRRTLSLYCNHRLGLARRLHVGHRLLVEIDADERLAARQRRPLRVGRRDPDVPDAAGPGELGVALALVRGQRIGDADAVGNWILRQVEVDGRFRRRAERGRVLLEWPL